MALRVFTLVLAALGTAAAFPATSEACFSKDKFTLSMHFKDETLHLTAVDSGQSGTGRSTGRSVNLVGLCDYSGTPGKNCLISTYSSVVH